MAPIQNGQVRDQSNTMNGPINILQLNAGFVQLSDGIRDPSFCCCYCWWWRLYQNDTYTHSNIHTHKYAQATTFHFVRRFQPFLMTVCHDARWTWLRTKLRTICCVLAGMMRHGNEKGSWNKYETMEKHFVFAVIAYCVCARASGACAVIFALLFWCSTRKKYH